MATPHTDAGSALLRAVSDAANLAYPLELVLELGQVVLGRNPNPTYELTFMGIAAGNSVSSGTMFSGNVLQQGWNGISTAFLEPASPETLGGLVFNAEITYDVDGDGSFDPAQPGGDEDYSCLMYIGCLGRDSHSSTTPNRTAGMP